MVDVTPQIHYRGGYKYQLTAKYIAVVPISHSVDINTQYISLMSNGILIIIASYAWDGPSGPAMDTKNAMRGSLVHDALYQLMREGKLPATYRPTVDAIYKGACLMDGMSAFRAWYHMKGISWFAASAAHPNNLKPVLAAP